MYNDGALLPILPCSGALVASICHTRSWFYFLFVFAVHSTKLMKQIKFIGCCHIFCTWVKTQTPPSIGCQNLNTWHKLRCHKQNNNNCSAKCFPYPLSPWVTMWLDHQLLLRQINISTPSFRSDLWVLSNLAMNWVPWFFSKHGWVFTSYPKKTWAMGQVFSGKGGDHAVAVGWWPSSFLDVLLGLLGSMDYFTYL